MDKLGLKKGKGNGTIEVENATLETLASSSGVIPPNTFVERVNDYENGTISSVGATTSGENAKTYNGDACYMGDTVICVYGSKMLIFTKNGDTLNLASRVTIPTSYDDAVPLNAYLLPVTDDVFFLSMQWGKNSNLGSGALERRLCRLSGTEVTFGAGLTGDSTSQPSVGYAILSPTLLIMGIANSRPQCHLRLFVLNTDALTLTLQTSLLISNSEYRLFPAKNTAGEVKVFQDHHHKILDLTVTTSAITVNSEVEISDLTAYDFFDEGMQGYLVDNFFFIAGTNSTSAFIYKINTGTGAVTKLGGLTCEQFDPMFGTAGGDSVVLSTFRRTVFFDRLATTSRKTYTTTISSTNNTFGALSPDGKQCVICSAYTYSTHNNRMNGLRVINPASSKVKTGTSYTVGLTQKITSTAEGNVWI